MVPFHVFLEYALFSTAINSVIHLWAPVMVGFFNSRRECVRARIHKPHLQIVALLGREAVQGHVGVELQDVLLQLVLLQLDSQAHKQSCALRTYNLALGERVKRGRNGRRVWRREHKSDTELSIVSRRNALEDSPLASTEKPLFTVRRSTVAMLELPLQSVPLSLPSNRNSGRAVTLISRLSLLCTCSKN